MTPGAIHGGEQFCIGALLETKGRWQHEIWWPIRKQIIADEAQRLGRSPTVGEQRGSFLPPRPRDLEDAPARERMDHRAARVASGAAPVIGPDLPFVRIGSSSRWWRSTCWRGPLR